MIDFLAWVGAPSTLVVVLGTAIGVYVLAAPTRREKRTTSPVRMGQSPSRLVRIGEKATPRRRGVAANRGFDSDTQPLVPPADDVTAESVVLAEAVSTAEPVPASTETGQAESVEVGLSEREPADAVVAAVSVLLDDAQRDASEHATENDPSDGGELGDSKGFFSFQMLLLPDPAPDSVKHWALQGGIRGDANDEAARRRFMHRLMLVDQGGARADLFAQAFRDDAALRSDLLQAVCEYDYVGGRPVVTLGLRGDTLALRPLAGRGAVCIRAEDLVDEALAMAHLPTVRSTTAALLKRDGYAPARARVEAGVLRVNLGTMRAIFDCL